MSYKIVFYKKAKKTLDSLPQQVRDRISGVIETLKHDPYPPSSRQLVDSPAYRIRVGDYRIIYEVQGEILTIEVIQIGHRREVYR